MHLVILTKDKAIATKIEADVSETIDIGVVSVHSTEDCMGLFSILPDIEVIVFDDFYKASIVKEIKNKELVIDLIHVGEGKYSDPDLNIHNFTMEENIGDFLKGNMGHANQRYNTIDDKEHYYPIITSTLKVMKKTPVDIFLRMKKESYFHYIKYIHGESEITDKQFAKLESIEKVFIKKEDKVVFFEDMNNVFISVLGNGGDISDAGGTEESVREEIFNALLSVGLTDRQVKVAEATITNVVDALQKGLLTEIKSIYKSDASLNYRKSYMTSVMCTSIAKNLSWLTEENKSALIMASFFNDRDLVRESMHYIDSSYGLEVSDYTKQEKQVFLSHAQKAADWVKDQKNVSPEVERIVRQHHGSHVGVGFETELTSQITKLSMVFMVAEAFSMDILKSKDGKFDAKTSLEAINDKYKHKHVKEIVEVLFKSLKT
jgi:HD-GYP domain-containing protein (c-di-GMP phosphodiesterase class II)